MYLLKLALRPWRLAPLSQVFTALAVGLLLLLCGFMIWMERGLKPVVARLQSEQVITAYLEGNLEPADHSQIVDSIRTAVGARAVDVKAVEAQDFVKELQPQYPELARELRELGGQSLSLIVPSYVSISGTVPEGTLEAVRRIPGVESAESSKDRFHHIVGAFKALRWVARILAAGLLLALLTGLIHLSKMNSYLHREPVSLLRLWGAGPWAMRAPALLSGLMIGASGGAIAALGWVVCGGWLAGQIRALSPMLNELQAPPVAVAAAAMCAIGIVSGLIAGVSIGNPSAEGSESRA